MRNIYILILIGIFLSSCATLPSLKIPQSFSSSNENGMIVGSIAFKNEEPIFNGYTFYYTGNGIDKITAQKIVSITPEQMTKMKFKPDFYDREKAVYYFSIEEPEGNYEFSNFRIFKNGGYIQSSSDIPINIEFEIEKGKVKYLGEIYVDYNQSFIGLNDESERDFRKLGEKFPNLKIE